MTSKGSAAATLSNSESTNSVMSGSRALTTFGAKALLTSLRSRVWSGGSRNRNPGGPMGRASAPAAISRCATADLSRSLADDGWRSTSSQSANDENTFSVMCGSCRGPRSRMRSYAGYGLARFDGSSSCSSRACGSAVAVIYLLCTRRVVLAQNVRAEFVELAGADRRANLVDEPDDKALVVDGGERLRQEFFRLEQMVQVGAGVVGARIAVAVGVDGAEVTPVPRIGDVEAAGRPVDRGVARDPRRRYAVESVGARRDRVEQIVGLADAQQVAGLVRGQLTAD